MQDAIGLEQFTDKAKSLHRLTNVLDHVTQNTNVETALRQRRAFQITANHLGPRQALLDRLDRAGGIFEATNLITMFVCFNQKIALSAANFKEPAPGFASTEGSDLLEVAPRRRPFHFRYAVSRLGSAIPQKVVFGVYLRQ